MNHRNAENLKYGLLETWNTFNHYMTEVLTFQNIEDVHQARVHLRKLLTFMKAYDMKPSAYRQLKHLMEALGLVRDGDVLVQHFVPQTELDRAFLNYVEEERAHNRTILSARVTEKMTPSLDQQVRRFIGGQLFRAIRKQDAADLLERAKAERKERIQTHHQAEGTTERLDTLHKVRLTIKRERYLHEYLLNYEEKASKEQIQKLKKMQIELGHLNDQHQLLLRWNEFSPPTELKSEYDQVIHELNDKLNAAVDEIEL